MPLGWEGRKGVGMQGKGSDDEGPYECLNLSNGSGVSAASERSRAIMWKTYWRI